MFSATDTWNVKKPDLTNVITPNLHTIDMNRGGLESTRFVPSLPLPFINHVQGIDAIL